ncbi:DNA cross-link repair protein [Quillaja saponaria]|uniref:DNA cross-link repair protein n=1 Tax=Quillaja saponaria TaxID=32244 RepID=A0AAD7LXW3_QUISA|nr:DNA cross-link repair protein [Quillaja saponaria]
MSDDDNDDFQIPLTQIRTSQKSTSSQKPLKPSNFNLRPSKKPKRTSAPIVVGKENIPPAPFQKLGFDENFTFSQNKVRDGSQYDGIRSNNCGSALVDRERYKLDENFSLDLIPSSIDCTNNNVGGGDLVEEPVSHGDSLCSPACDEKKELKINGGYFSNAIESKLMVSRLDCCFNNGHGSSTDAGSVDDFEVGTELDVLLNLCSEVDEEDSTTGMAFYHHGENCLNGESGRGLIQCPLCGTDISNFSEDQRQVHTNNCLDRGESRAQDVILPDDDMNPQVAPQVVNISPVVGWLHNLGLSKYEDVFVREEIDWDTLRWLTEEDLLGMGITALGPRKKIVHALSELRKGSATSGDRHVDTHALTDSGKRKTHRAESLNDSAEGKVDETSKPVLNKLITDYFPGSSTERKKDPIASGAQHRMKKTNSDSGRKKMAKNNVRNGKFRDVPSWCSIPGTPFRVDAFRYLRGDCSHWFLSHFHMDHYQGLTRSFRHGKIYCSAITAGLVNMKIGIPWDKLVVLPLNQKINIAGIDVTCLDANHCPGSIIILFEPPNDKAVLHTGDFRFSEDMASNPLLQMCPIHTLILDTTYCNPQYDFPKQEAVIQFVIEAIQAETFNPKTLFLIGSYTIGKERLFLEVARVLRKKVYVTAPKLRLLQCLGFLEEDMQWFTLNDRESNIHIVPMWTLASFKRLKHIANQYASRFSLIVAFSPTGWTFGKGKKKCPGRRWQQGTIIRYEVPYSEHCSFTELKDFVKLISPVNIIPSVNNDGPDSTNAMISLMIS